MPKYPFVFSNIDDNIIDVNFHTYNEQKQSVILNIHSGTCENIIELIKQGDRDFIHHIGYYLEKHDNSDYAKTLQQNNYFINTTTSPSIELYELSAIKGNPNAHYRLGLYYEKHNVGYKIEYHFDRALNSDGCWMALYKMAEYSMRQNKTCNTYNCLTAVIKHDFPLAELNLAILYLNDNELDNAKLFLTKLTTNATNDNHIGYHGLAYYYLAIVEKAQNGSTTTEIDHFMNSYKLGNMDSYRKLHSTFNVKPYDKRYVFLLAQYFQKHSVTIPRDHYFKLYHEHATKYQTVGVCNRCEKQGVARMPYGLNYHCCETCMTLLKQTFTLRAFYDNCKKFIYSKYFKETDPFKEFGDFYLKVEKTSKTNGYCNEIIYVTFRMNNELYAQIKKMDFEQYKTMTWLRAKTQMLFYIAKTLKTLNEKQLSQIVYSEIYDNLKLTTDGEITRYNEHAMSAKALTNYGVILKNNNEFTNAMKCFNLSATNDGGFAFWSAGICMVQYKKMESAKALYFQSIKENCDDALPDLQKVCSGEEFDDYIFKYFDGGQIALFEPIRKHLNNDYRFYKIINRLTNIHWSLKPKIKLLERFEKYKTDECIVCLEKCCDLVPMNCGHFYCEECLPKMNGKCAYRCVKPL